MEVLENLKKGEVYEFMDESTIEISDMIDRAVGKYAFINDLSNNNIPVVRVSTDNLQKIVFSSCDELNKWCFKRISKNIDYVKILVNKYNKYTDENILVVERNGYAYIYKDVTEDDDLEAIFNEWKKDAINYTEEKSIRKNTKGKEIFDICKTINPFESIEIDCSYNYAVAMVSEFGDKDIKAVKKDGDVFIERKFDIFRKDDPEYVKKASFGFSKFMGAEPEEEEYEDDEYEDENDSDDENEYKDEPQDFEYDEEPLM